MTDSVRVHLPRALVDRVNNLAEDAGMSPTSWIRETVETAVTEAEGDR